MKLRVYFHKDFDGICSAAVFVAYIRSVHRGSTFDLIPVDYDLKRQWGNKALERPCAILDFLYHPDAEWWFDHHSTTFVRKDWELHYEPDAHHQWQPAYRSCPGLIIDSIPDDDIRAQLRSRFAEAVQWCDLIDSASYLSPQQVIDATEAALRINASLTQNATPEYLASLVFALEESSLTIVAELDEVSNRYRKTREWQERALEFIRKTAVSGEGVAFIDYAGHSELFHRYAVYYLWPDTDFQVAVYKMSGWHRVTVTANPWKTNHGPNIGAICERFGGGGHQCVGGIIAKSPRHARRAADEIVKLLRQRKPFYEQLSLRDAIETTSIPTAAPTVR
jgi:hypothetical protein